MNGDKSRPTVGEEFWGDVLNSEGQNSAVFSDDRRYRYLLRRGVGESSGRVLFIMLNPSRADETRNDATIRRCIGFARDWGFGLLDVVNLFALMSTDPAALLKAEDPVGPDNDAAIRAALRVADAVVLAWGNHALDHGERAAAVTEMAWWTTPPYCLGLTKRGAPRHPLRLPKTATLESFPAPARTENQRLMTEN